MGYGSVGEKNRRIHGTGADRNASCLPNLAIGRASDEDLRGMVGGNID
jgi:hypothetical protein